jgi:hypothetical protein
VSSAAQHPAQQSASAVQAPPAATQPPGLQTRLPLASGAHTPLQHTSPKAQLAPSATQQIEAPLGPGLQPMSGYVSVQHSLVIVHVCPGRTQPGTPPKQRFTPELATAQPVSPPPAGQQLALAAVKQTSPASRQASGFVQRMRGRPSAVVPDAAQVPEQHWASALQISLIGRQPPKNAQVATPDPLSTQAFEQHEPETPGLPHGSPTTPHEPTAAQWPTASPPGRSQYRLQQSRSAAHSSPCARQAFTWPHRQPLSAAVQAVPAALPQKSLQQLFALVHASPMGSQLSVDPAQVVPPQLYEQQSSSPAQPPPVIAQAPEAGPQAPPSQFRLQQSLSSTQPTPSAAHSPDTLWPPSAQVTPGTHAPPSPPETPSTTPSGATGPSVVTSVSSPHPPSDVARHTIVMRAANRGMSDLPRGQWRARPKRLHDANEARLDPALHERQRASIE